jgi:hypothetical protein
MAKGNFRNLSNQCTMCGNSKVVAKEGKGANKWFMCSDCLWKTILSEIKNNESMQYLTIFELDASDISKNDMIEILYDMERLGYDFSDDDFHIVDGDRDITKLYMNESLQGGWYRKYMSKEELSNKMN